MNAEIDMNIVVKMFDNLKPKLIFSNIPEFKLKTCTHILKCCLEKKNIPSIRHIAPYRGVSWGPEYIKKVNVMMASY